MLIMSTILIGQKINRFWGFSDQGSHLKDPVPLMRGIDQVQPIFRLNKKLTHCFVSFTGWTEAEIFERERTENQGERAECSQKPIFGQCKQTNDGSQNRIWRANYK